MKMRFLTALRHELPGADLSCASLRTRNGRLRFFETVPLDAQILRRSSVEPRAGESVSSASCELAQDWWRFASMWRKKEIEGFNPVPERRKLFHRWAAGISVLAVLLLAGCQSEMPAKRFQDVNTLFAPTPAALEMTMMTNRLDPELLRAPTNLFTLGPGDKLDIELGDETNSLTTTVVGPDGKIYFNLLPGLDVWGLSVGQTRDTIEHELGKYIRGEPQVTVALRDVQSKRVWMLGRFQRPGIYTLSVPTTLLEAIAAAGGSQSFAGQRQIGQGGPLGEDLADLSRSFVVRNGKMLPVDFEALLEKGDLSQNIYLEPDDFIYFTPGWAKEVYVLGAVTQPQAVQYVKNMTLMQAIAGAYGTVRDAYLAHVMIVRGSLTQPQVAALNYYDIVQGKSPDVPLEPNDIVYVPLTPYRYLRKYLDIALNTFVSSVAINAGVKATQPPVSNVIIPVGGGGTTTPPPVPPIH